MKLTMIVITLLLVMGFVSGYMGFFGALAGQYGTNIPENFASMNMSSSMASNIQTDIANQQDKIDTAQNESSNVLGGATAPVNLISGAFSAGMMLLNAPNYFIAIVSDLTNAAGMPNWVGTMLIGIISISILGAIIYFITQRDV